MCGCMMYVCVYIWVYASQKMATEVIIPKSLVFFCGARRIGFMWQQGCRCVSAHAMATTTRGPCHHLSPPHLCQAAHRDPRRLQKKRSHRWSVAWQQHPVRQMLVALAVALLVVAANETETVWADNIASRTVP